MRDAQSLKVEGGADLKVLASELQKTLPDAALIRVLEDFSVSLMEGRGSPPTGEQVELTVIRLVALLSHSRRAVRASCIAALNSLLGPMRLVRGEFSPTVAGWAELARRTLKLADFQTILCNFCSDYDAIVRAAALRSLLQINDLSNDLLPQLRENYSLFVSMLKDFSEEVRELAMMIIWRIGVTPLDSTEPSPLEDDAFVKICGCVNDGDLHVRAAAFRLLGTFRKVSEQLLIQTLQKSVIQQHRGSTNVKQPGRIGQWKQRSIPSESTETTGDVDIDAPNTGPPTLVAVTETQLKTGTIGASVSFAGSAWSDFLPVDAQACGAFVHGLEDEYELVRNTAVDAMRELCLASQAFADKALFCFIDMFNDEMHSVRLNSVKSFRAIVNPPDDEQQVESDAMDTGSDEEASKRGGVIVDGLHRLRNILMVLHDADKAVRLEGHRMCSGVCVRNLQDLNVFINELMRNIRRHPDDLISVYECLRDVGRNHPKLIGKQVDRFFNLDPRFTVSEINMEDRAHIGNMILVFNAASEEEGSKSVDAMNSSYILGRVPTYAFRHYLYMRDQYPGCFPAIDADLLLQQREPLNNAVGLRRTKAPDTSGGVDLEKTIPDVMDVEIRSTHVVLAESLQTLMQEVVPCIGNNDVDEYRANDLQQLLENYARNVRSIGVMSVELNPICSFFNEWIECCLIVSKIKLNMRRSTLRFESCIEAASQLMRLAYTMSTTYQFGPSLMHTFASVQSALQEFRLLAHIIWFLVANPALSLQQSRDTNFRGQRLLESLMKKWPMKIEDKMEEDDVEEEIVEVSGTVARKGEAKKRRRSIESVTGEIGGLVKEPMALDEPECAKANLKSSFEFLSQRIMTVARNRQSSFSGSDDTSTNGSNPGDAKEFYQNWIDKPEFRSRKSLLTYVESFPVTLVPLDQIVPYVMSLASESTVSPMTRKNHCPHSEIKRATAELLEPQPAGSTEEGQKAFLVNADEGIGVAVRARVYDVEDVTKIAIQISGAYPEFRTFFPPLQDITPEGKGVFLIDTIIDIYDPPSSASYKLVISIAQYFELEYPTPDLALIYHPTSTASIKHACVPLYRKNREGQEDALVHNRSSHRRPTSQLASQTPSFGDDSWARSSSTGNHNAPQIAAGTYTFHPVQEAKMLQMPLGMYQTPRGSRYRVAPKAVIVQQEREEQQASRQATPVKESSLLSGVSKLKVLTKPKPPGT